MGEKRCCTCHVMRDLTAFNKRSTSPDGLQSRCRECSAAWYDANKETHKANVRVRAARARGQLRDQVGRYLLEHPCVDCGEPDIRVLEFDHEDPAEKASAVVVLVDQGASWDRVAAEIAKCSVRCANCHRRRTADMFGYWRRGFELERRAVWRDLAARRLDQLLEG